MMDDMIETVFNIGSVKAKIVGVYKNVYSDVFVLLYLLVQWRVSNLGN